MISRRIALQVSVCIILILNTIPNLEAQNIDLDKVHAEESFRWGVKAFHNGYFNNAITSFENALSFEPDDEITRIWLGRAFYKSGLEEQALHEWEYVRGLGKSTALLNSWIDFISYRRSLARELDTDKRYVLSHEIDANQESFYQFRRPTSVRACSDGSVMVVAFATNEIVKLDVNSQILDIFNGGIQEFDHPFDVLEAGGFLFISEYSGNRITKCDLSGRRVLSFGTRGTGPGELLGPQYLAAHDGYIYVTDYGNARVNKYDLEGNFILSFGGRTLKFHGLSSPTGIAVQDDRIFVADRKEKDLSIFDLSGNYLNTIGDMLENPEGLFLSGPKNLLVADGTRIVELNIDKETSRIIEDFSVPPKRIVNTSINANGELLAVDFDLSRIFFLSPRTNFYAGYFVRIEKIESDRFPEILVDVSVTDRSGRSIIGLMPRNFQIYELGFPIETVELIPQDEKSFPLTVIVLIEKSLEAENQSMLIRQVVESIYESFQDMARIKIVSAGKTAKAESGFGQTRLRLLEAATRGEYTSAWQFDVGIRTAATELFQSRGRKAIIYISQGKLGSHPYDNYSIMELTQVLKNNFIQFNAIYLHSGNPHPDIEYICSETDGRSALYYQPQGAGAVFESVKKSTAAVYVLRFVSPTDPDFGRKYIQIETEVTLQKKNGYDRSGYFSDLEF